MNLLLEKCGYLTKNRFIWFKPVCTAQSANPSGIILFKRPEEQYIHDILYTTTYCVSAVISLLFIISGFLIFLCAIANFYFLLAKQLSNFMGVLWMNSNYIHSHTYMCLDHYHSKTKPSGICKTCYDNPVS